MDWDLERYDCFSSWVSRVLIACSVALGNSKGNYIRLVEI